ncbi:glycosyltransferase family 39 protein [Patescibacteria group bacterium]|nr:glycosyltransferase family 39 protein [Patescibacteria group bacterium]
MRGFVNHTSARNEEEVYLKILAKLNLGWLLLPACLLVCLQVLLTQHTAWPEMLVYPYLLNHGFVPYQDLIAPYTPLLLWFLQFLEKIFGSTPQFSVSLTLTFALINTSLVGLITYKLNQQKDAAFLASLFYALWFAYFGGNGLWFELLQTPLILGSYYFFEKSQQIKKNNINLWITSFLLTIIFFTKQSGLWFVLAVSFWLVLFKQWRVLLNFIKTTFLVFLLFFLLIGAIAWINNYWSDYFYWVYIYTFTIFPFSPGHQSLPQISQLLKFALPLLIILPSTNMLWKRDSKTLLGLLFCGAAFMSVLPRWDLFHLQPFLALIAIIFVPIAWRWVRINKIRQLLGLSIVLIWLIVVLKQADRFYQLPVRFFEPSIYSEANQLKRMEVNSFYVFNGPDQLYILVDSQTLVKPYVQNFAWYFEVPGMQQKVINALIKDDPQYVILSPFLAGSGYEIGHYIPQDLNNYIHQHYTLDQRINDNIEVLKRID